MTKWGIDRALSAVYSRLDVHGRELKQIRHQLGLTQAELAAEVGVVANTVARWERDEVPISPVAARLLQVLKPKRRSRTSVKKTERKRARTRKLP
jgi:DNA-binding transcriptional regulator YiaG